VLSKQILLELSAMWFNIKSECVVGSVFKIWPDLDTVLHALAWVVVHGVPATWNILFKESNFNGGGVDIPDSAVAVTHSILEGPFFKTQQLTLAINHSVFYDPRKSVDCPVNFFQIELWGRLLSFSRRHLVRFDTVIVCSFNIVHLPQGLKIFIAINSFNKDIDVALISILLLHFDILFNIFINQLVAVLFHHVARSRAVEPTWKYWIFAPDFHIFKLIVTSTEQFLALMEHQLRLQSIGAWPRHALYDTNRLYHRPSVYLVIPELLHLPLGFFRKQSKLRLSH